MRFTTSLCMMFLVCLASCQQRTPPSGTETPAPPVPPAAEKDSPSAAADKAAAEKAAADKAAAEKAAERNQAIWKLCRKILSEDKLNLNDSVGSMQSSSSEGQSWTMYHDSVNTPAEADQIVRTVHRELWQLVEQQGWGRPFAPTPTGELIHRFELQYKWASRTRLSPCLYCQMKSHGWARRRKRAECRSKRACRARKNSRTHRWPRDSFPAAHSAFRQHGGVPAGQVILLFGVKQRRSSKLNES